jgi:Na+/phosphate symporter
MVDRSRSWARLVLWVLALVLVGYAFLEDEDDGAAEESTEEVVSVGPGARLRIVEIKPADANPGAAVVVRVSGHDPADSESLRAVIAKQDLEVVHRGDDRIVVQIPSDIELGPAKLRVRQGDRRSKPRIVHVKPVQRRKVVRNVVGGLALFILGLASVAQGLRAYAGQRIRRLLGRLTRSSARSIGVGTVVGGLTQSTTSSAGLLVGLLDARMLASRPAVAVLLGAHLGAAVTVSLLPFAATREALLVVAFGVLWVSLAGSRRSRGLGKAILGVGLLFYGLHLLRIGFQPVIADPEVLPYLQHLRAGDVRGLMANAGMGAVLCGILQGPGPVFAVVLGITQSTGLLGVEDALAVLAGTSFGAVVGTLAVGWPFGSDGRRLGVAHALFGLLMTVLVLVSLPLWTALADALVPGDPSQLAYGKKILLPNAGTHLAVAFAASQMAAVLLVAPAVPFIAGLAERAAAREPGTKARRGTDAAGIGPREVDAFCRALELCGEALEATFEVARTGEGAPAAKGESALVGSRDQLEAVLRTSAQAGADPAVRSAAIACMHLQSSIDAALRVAERGVARGLELSAADSEALRGLHDLVIEGQKVVLEDVRAGREPDLEAARAREIRLNALEAAHRREVVEALEEGGEAASPRLLPSDLVAAYETVGNHLFRTTSALAVRVDDELG